MNQNFKSEFGAESERACIRHSYQAKFISHPQHIFPDLVVYGKEARALRIKQERNPNEDSNSDTANNSQVG